MAMRIRRSAVAVYVRRALVGVQSRTALREAAGRRSGNISWRAGGLHPSRVARRGKVVERIRRRGAAEAHRRSVERELRRARRRGTHPPSTRPAHDHARRSVSHRDGQRQRDGRANAGYATGRIRDSRVDSGTLPRRRDGGVGNRFLGQVSQRHGSGTGNPARHAVGGARRARQRGRPRRARLLHAPRAGPRARDRATDTHRATGIAASDSRRGDGRHRVDAGRARGRTACLHRGVGDHRHGTLDHAAGECAQHSPRTESRADSARSSAGRSAGTRRGPRRDCRRAFSSAGRTSVRPNKP